MDQQGDRKTFQLCVCHHVVLFQKKGQFCRIYKTVDLSHICFNVNYICLNLGFPLLMVALSLVIASRQDGGVSGYVHGDL